MDWQTARELATKVFKGSRWLASEENIDRLTRAVLLLEEKGLNKLNQNLVDNRRKVWDFVAELNFATELITYHGPSVLMEYEPDGLNEPPDFKVQIGDLIFWLQMKKLSKSESNNRRHKTVEKIKQKIKGIKKQMRFLCNFSISW